MYNNNRKVYNDCENIVAIIYSKNSDIVYQKTLEKKLHIENLGTICICRYEHVEIKL